MTALEAIQKIKAMFNESAPVAPVNQFAGTEYPLADGTVCMIDKLEVGGTVMIGDQPAPDGDLALADGTVVSVAGGKITNITQPAAATVAPAPNFDEQFTAINGQLSQFTATVTELNQKFLANDQKFADLDGKVNKCNEAISQLIQLMEKSIQLPAADPVQKPANGFKEQKEDRLKSLSMLLQTIKNNKN